MTGKRNNVIPNGHFHKDWQRYIKLWFNQPMRKKRRHLKRVEKAKKLAPRPIKMLRPVISCPSLKYNAKLRLGRGFTLEELKQAGIPKKLAKTIGIAIDYRRVNKSVDSIQRNVRRLKVYQSKMILFPLNPKKPRVGDATAEEVKLATQLKGIVMPLRNRSSRPREAARVATKDEKDFEAKRFLRKTRGDHKYKGARERKARQEAEAAEKTK